MDRPLVSIVTPSYNQAPFLEQTIRSVLNQTYPLIQYIIIDGGSTDTSPAIIRRDADRLFYWCSEKDEGQTDALSKGLTRATGEIVCWLNSDDLYFPDTIEKVVTAFRRHPEDVVYGDYTLITATGVPF